MQAAFRKDAAPGRRRRCLAEPPEVLPVLRPDLKIHPGPPAEDGTPTFTLYDPLNGTYDKLGWAAACVLERLRRRQTLESLLEELRRETTVRATPDEIKAVCDNAVRSGLTADHPARPVEELTAEAEKMRVGPLKRLLGSYLFFRIPLLRPDGFLERTVSRVRLLASKPALALYGLLTLLGVVMLLQQTQEYFATFTYFFNMTGLLVFGASIVLVKTVHEFSHAYTAKAFGVRVPAMGLAFIVFWPVAYCDVTDAWKIPSRKKRLAISTAGVLSELIIAGLALFAWGVSPDGLARSVFFVASSSSLLSTILVNTNPAMRYDGYYILMDLWGIDNLQPRAFAMTRWFYRKYLLGMDFPRPEPACSPRRTALMVCYSIGAWIYRLLLYLAIAAVVYYKFTKALGVILFAVEIWWFILAPVGREAAALLKQRTNIKMDKRILTTGTILILLLLWLALPLPRRFSAPAAVVPAREQVLYVPHAGRLDSFDLKRGQTVAPGLELVRIVSEELLEHIRILQLEKQSLDRKKQLYTLEEKNKALLPQLMEEIHGVEARLKGLEQQLEQTRLTALESGTLFEWDEALYPGRFVSENQVLGKIADLSKVVVYAFVDEERVKDIAPGDEAVFVLDADPRPVKGVVRSVSPVRAETMKHPALTSIASGALPVIEGKGGGLKLLETRYTLELELSEKIDRADDFRFGQSGQAWLTTRPRSRLLEAARYAYRILVRESSF